MESMPEALSEHKYNIINARGSTIVDSITRSANKKNDDNNECVITDKDYEMFCTETNYKSDECASNLNEINQVQELQRCQDSNATHYHTPFAGSSARCSESNCKNGSETSSNAAVWEMYSDVYAVPDTPYIYNKLNRRGNCLESNRKDIVCTSSFDINVHLGDVAPNANSKNLSNDSIINSYLMTKSCFAYQACTSNKDEYVCEKNSKASLSSTSQSINSQQLQPYVQLLRRQMQGKQDKVNDSNYSDEEKAVSPIFTYAFQRKLANRLRQTVAEAHNNNCNNNSINKTFELSNLQKVRENSIVETEQGEPNVVCNQGNKFVDFPFNLNKNNNVTHSPVYMEMLSQPCSEQRKRTSQECNTLHSSETSKEGNVGTSTITNVNAKKAHEEFVSASLTNKLTEHEYVARSLFASPMHFCMEKNAITNKQNQNSERNSVNRSGEEENITESCLLLSTLNKTPLLTTSSSSSSLKLSASNMQRSREVLRCKEENFLQNCITKEVQSQEINYEQVELANKEAEEHHPQEQEESEQQQQQKEEHHYRTNTQECYGYRQKQACAKKSTPLCNVTSTTPMESENKLSKMWEECVKAKLEIALEKWQAVIYIKVMCLSMHSSLGVNHTDGKENGIEADTSLHSHELKTFMERRIQLNEAIMEAEHASQCLAYRMRYYVQKMNAVILQLLNTHQYSFALQLLLKADELVREGAGMEFVLDKLTCDINIKKREVKSESTKASVTVDAANNTKNDNKETNSVTHDHVNEAYEEASSTMYIDEIDAHVLALCCKMNTQRVPEEYCKYDTLLMDNIVLPINVHVKHAIIHRSSNKSLEAQQRVQEMLSLHIPYFTSAETQERVYCTSITYNNFGLYHYHISEYALAVVRLQEAALLEAQLPEQYVKLPGVTYLNLAQAEFMAYKQQNERHRYSNYCNNSSGDDNANYYYLRKSQKYNFFRSLERATQLTIDKLHNLTRECEQYVHAQEEKEEEEYLCQLQELKKLQELKDYQEEKFLSGENTIDDNFVIYQPDDANTHKATISKNISSSAANNFIDNVNSMSNKNMYCKTNAEHTVNEFARFHVHFVDAQSKKSYIGDVVDNTNTINNVNNKEANIFFAAAAIDKNVKRIDSNYTRTLTLWLQKREQVCLLVKIKTVETELYESFHQHEHALEAINRAVMWCEQISHRTKDEENQLETILLLQRKIRQKCERQELERVMYDRTLQHNHRKNVKTANYTMKCNKNKSYTKSSDNPFELLHTRETSTPMLSTPKHTAYKSNNTLLDGHTHIATTLLPRTIHIIDEVQRRPISVPQPTNDLKLPSRKSNITKSRTNEENSEIFSKTASRVQHIACKHTSPYMVRQQMSSAPLRTRKAWDNDVHLSNTTTLKTKKQEQVKNCNVIVSRQENCNEDDIVTTIDDDDKNSKTFDVSAVSNEASNENNRKSEFSSVSSPSSEAALTTSSSSSLFRTRLHASCEESKTINMMTKLISCADIVNAFIRYKLSKCVVDKKRLELDERSGARCKTPSLLVQSTLSSEENYQNEHIIDKNSDGAQDTENKSDKNDSAETTSSRKSITITDSSSSAQCVNDNESKLTNTFEMIFVHSACKRHHNEDTTSQEASVSDHNSTKQMLTSE